MAILLMPYGSAGFAGQISKVGNGAPPPIPAPPKIPSPEAGPGDAVLPSPQLSWRRGSKGNEVRIDFFEPYGRSGQAPLVAKASEVPLPPPKTGLSRVRRLNAGID